MISLEFFLFFFFFSFILDLPRAKESSLLQNRFVNSESKEMVSYYCLTRPTVYTRLPAEFFWFSQQFFLKIYCKRSMCTYHWLLLSVQMYFCSHLFVLNSERKKKPPKYQNCFSKTLLAIITTGIQKKLMVHTLYRNVANNIYTWCSVTIFNWKILFNSMFTMFSLSWQPNCDVLNLCHNTKFSLHAHWYKLCMYCILCQYLLTLIEFRTIIFYWVDSSIFMLH